MEQINVQVAMKENTPLMSSTGRYKSSGEQYSKLSESSPLVDNNNNKVDEERPRRDERPYVAPPPAAWDEELRCLVRLALPITGKSVVEMLPGMVSIMLVGQLSDTSRTGNENVEYAIDATATAVMFMNMTALAVGIGLNSALDTLCSQAHGAWRARRVGDFVRTGLLVSVSWSGVVGLLFLNCERILKALGQPALVSEMAGTYVLWLLPGVPFLLVYDVTTRAMQARNVVYPQLFVAVVANLVHASVGYYLVYHTSMGWLGAALARSVCNVSFFVMLVPFVKDSDLAHAVWTDLDLRVTAEGVGQYLRLGVPGMLQTCLEWWALEVLTLVCGRLPDAETAIGANTIVVNLLTLTFMLYVGLSISCTVRVGNALGANDPDRAELVVRSALGAALAVALSTGAVLIAYGDVVPHLFTQDPEITSSASRLIKVIALFQIADAVNGVVQGAFRGSARQATGARLNFAGYYLLAIPLGCLAAFWLSAGVVGLWTGMTLGLLVCAGYGTRLLLRGSDWSLLAAQAERRVKND